MNFWGSVAGNLSQIAGFLLAALTAVTAVHVREWYLKRSKRDLQKILSNDSTIYQIISELRVVAEADRVKVFQFINGNYYFGGTSDQKMCLTHLVNKPGISYPEGLTGSRQNIPISHATGLIQDCLENPSVVVRINNLEHLPYLKQVFINNGTSAVLAAGLFNPKKQCVGIMMATWVLEENTLTPEQITGIQERVDRLSAAISS